MQGKQEPASIDISDSVSEEAEDPLLEVRRKSRHDRHEQLDERILSR